MNSAVETGSSWITGAGQQDDPGDGSGDHDQDAQAKQGERGSWIPVDDSREGEDKRDAAHQFAYERQEYPEAGHVGVMKSPYAHGQIGYEKSKGDQEGQDPSHKDGS